MKRSPFSAIRAGVTDLGGEDPLFQAPPQADLGRRLAVVLGDGGEGGVVQHPAPGPGAPGLHQDAVVPAEGQGLPLLAAGWNSIWFTMGATSVSSRAFRWWGRKLDTPMARIFPAW